MSGKRAKIERKLARKALTKDFGKNYAVDLTNHVITTWQNSINELPLKGRLVVAWMAIRGKL